MEEQKPDEPSSKGQQKTSIPVPNESDQLSEWKAKTIEILEEAIKSSLAKSVNEIDALLTKDQNAQSEYIQNALQQPTKVE